MLVFLNINSFCLKICFNWQNCLFTYYKNKNKIHYVAHNQNLTLQYFQNVVLNELLPKYYKDWFYSLTFVLWIYTPQWSIYIFLTHPSIVFFFFWHMLYYCYYWLLSLLSLNSKIWMPHIPYFRFHPFFAYSIFLCFMEPGFFCMSLKLFYLFRENWLNSY